MRTAFSAGVTFGTMKKKSPIHDMSQVHWFACLVLATLPVMAQSQARPPYPEGLYAEVTTPRGLVVIQLELEKTPVAVANFVGLAEGTIANRALPLGTPFFDGSAFHRVVPGHVAQGGMPAGSPDEGPGYEFPNEIVPGLSHQLGMVNMANGGPHTNGSQWCFILGDRAYLDGDYTVFGQVIQGMDAVLKIQQGDRMEHVRIVRIGPKAETFHPDTASFQKLVEVAKARVKADEIRKAKTEATIIAKRWPHAKGDATGLKVQVLREGRGDLAKPGDHLKVAYTGTTLYGKTFASTSAGGPWWGDKGQTFDFQVGTTHLNPALDVALAHMKPGEKRLLIVPPPLGYGTSGLYPPERIGEKRFVISPNTVLVYEVDVAE
jgi:cyclophilin family peptidyl-prolyl cis-trans isomerase